MQVQAESRADPNMFRAEIRQTPFRSAMDLSALIYHSTVRSVRRSHGNALIGLVSSIFQSIVFVGVFYLMYNLLGMRANSIRGDFVLYLMSGVFLFLTHTKAIGAVFGSEGPTSAMMLHAPMNTAIAISSAALGSLYIQVLSLLVLLFFYHVAVTPLTIENPVGALSMVLLAWLSGVSVGMVFLAMKPWVPGFAGIAQMVYSRANMFASGKMFVANTLTYTMLKMFDWNPLFHVIDQARGFTFINYNPHNSSIAYPIYVTIALLMIGLMGEFFTRRRASLSWGARQ
jgi:ABC-type polysaccharide/polyol phosphate export permease